MANREVIGIVTQIDKADARPDLAESWLKLAGCKKVFKVSSKTGEGLDILYEYLKKPKHRISQKNQQNNVDN